MPQPILLHIGLHKTGTSYLQKRLLQNRILLKRYGLELAKGIDPQTGHHHALLGHLPPNGDLEEFIAALTTGKATLMTSECLITWLMRSETAQDLAQALLEKFEPKIILMLRRQDFLKESIYAEVATSWYQGSIEDEDHYWYDFEIMINRLADLFGISQLRIGIYRDDIRQDLMAAFLHCCDLTLTADQLEDVPHQRVSLNRRKVALLAACPKRRRATLEQLRGAIEQSEWIQPDSYRHLLSPQQRRNFLKPLLAGNRRICQYFCPEAEAYMSSMPDLDEDWQPVNPLTTVEIANLLIEISGQQSESIIAQLTPRAGQ